MLFSLPDEIIKHVHTFNDFCEIRNYVLVCKNFYTLLNDVRQQKMCHLMYLNNKYGIDQTFFKMETVEQAEYYVSLIQPHIWHDWWPRLKGEEALISFIQDKVFEYYKQMISGVYTERQSVEYYKFDLIL